MLYVPGAPSQQQVEVQLTVINASSTTWTAADTGVRYRWLAADGATAIATGATVPLGADLAPNGSRSYDLLVDPPALPDGASKARYLLRFDVVELPGALGYASKGNRPLEQFVTVQKPLAGQLGLERYYHYAGEPLGLGASKLVNLGTGNNLLRALIVWSGWGSTPWPLRQDAAVVEAFGAKEAPALLESIRELEDDFYSTDARLTIADLDAMAAAAAAEFRERHPELADEAVQALAWCYTFDYK